MTQTFFFKEVKFHISQASFKYYVAKKDLELGFPALPLEWDYSSTKPAEFGAED